MIQFLITAAFVLVFVFILFLLLSLMAWILRLDMEKGETPPKP